MQIEVSRMYLYIDDEKLDSNVFKETYGISEIERVVHFPDFPSHKQAFFHSYTDNHSLQTHS